MLPPPHLGIAPPNHEKMKKFSKNFIFCFFIIILLYIPNINSPAVLEIFLRSWNRKKNLGKKWYHKIGVKILPSGAVYIRISFFDQADIEIELPHLVHRSRDFSILLVTSTNSNSELRKDFLDREKVLKKLRG